MPDAKRFESFMMRSLVHLAAVAALMILPAAGEGSTRDVGGQVVSVGELQDDGSRRFTIRASYFGNYTPRGQPGLEWTTRVGLPYSATLLNGEPINTRHFARAIRPGMWGHAYERAQLSFYTLPDFESGEVIDHDPDNRRFTLRIHITHHGHNLVDKGDGKGGNPPREVEFSYDADAAFRIEDKDATAAEGLKEGHWLPVHPPRKQTLDVRTPEAAFDPDLLRPYWIGGRHYANTLTAPAILRGFRMRNPHDVDGTRSRLEVSILRDGQVRDLTVRGGGRTMLDGKEVPSGVAHRVGRYVVLAYNRGYEHPGYMWVRSRDRAVRGRIESVAEDGRSITVALTDPLSGEPTGERREVELRDDAVYELDGIEAEADEALAPGRAVTIFPQRGPTNIAFPLRTEDEPAFSPGDTVAGEITGRRMRPTRPESLTRFDLQLGPILAWRGPTLMERLIVSLTMRGDEVETLTLADFHAPAGTRWSSSWAPTVTRPQMLDVDLTYDDGRLHGEFSFRLKGSAEREGHPLHGRLTVEIDARVKANHVSGRASLSRNGEHVRSGSIQTLAVSGLPNAHASLTDAVYELMLEDPQQRIPSVPLKLEARNREFTAGVVAYFPSPVEVDVSDLRLEGPRIRGPIHFRVPAEHAEVVDRPLDVTLDLEVTERPGGYHTGRFEGKWGREE